MTSRTRVICGPVIIENRQVLLVKERAADGTVSQWQFPGGTMELTDASPEAACRREAREEIGVELKLLRELLPLNSADTIGPITLKHYLAQRHGVLQPGPEIAAMRWWDTHNLPPDCALNIVPVITEYLKNEH